MGRYTEEMGRYTEEMGRYTEEMGRYTEEMGRKCVVFFLYICYDRIEEGFI